MPEPYLVELFELQDQTAVVIGGAGVLGGALCRGLVQAGAQVVVADLTEEACRTRVDELTGLGGRASYCTVDVTSVDSLS